MPTGRSPSGARPARAVEGLMHRPAPARNPCTPLLSVPSAGPAAAEGGWRLVPPGPAHAAVVARWSTSAAEARAWVSAHEHPFPPERVAAWWDAADVHAWLLLDPEDAPVAYGELWDDEAEDEVELARLIVAPDRRRQGVGRRLVDELVALALTSGRATRLLRVVPDNAAALALYRSAGFRDVGPDLAGEWNRGQPVAYAWLTHEGAPGGPGLTPPAAGPS